MSESAIQFRRCLSRQRRWWQAGLLLHLAMRLTGWALILGTGYVLLDYLLAFESITRAILDAALLTWLAVLLLTWAGRVLRLDNRRMAERADALVDSRRRPVLSAMELDAWLNARSARTPAPESDADLPAFLVSRSIDGATAALRAIPFRRYFPLPELRRRLCTLLVQGILAMLVLGFNLHASHVILARLTHPYHDIPPYSTLVFHISPDRPDVLYGGTTDIAVEVTGAPVKSGVWFITRSGAVTHRVACFQESNTGAARYAQRLEKVVAPVEFCFATGKARSRWHRVNILLDPKISVATAALTPPAYSRLPRRRFLVGQEELTGLKQSELELTVGSNRPLLDGQLTLRPTGKTGPSEIIAGERTGPRSVTFRWNLKYPAELDIAIRDVTGTRNLDPFRVQQKIIPDQPPTALITQPAGFALATPSITIPLVGHVEDDLGLTRVDLLHTVVGYRDRPRPLGPLTADRRQDFAESIDLRKLGVEPGQVLEFYIEALDSNPALTGLGMSEIARVQIISEEEYATMVRARITLEEFMERYRALALHLAELRRAVQDLRDTAADPGATVARRQAGLDRARAAMHNATQLFTRAARDFPAFDIEQKLVATMLNLAGKTGQWSDQLDQAKSDSPELADMAADMFRELGGHDQEFQTQVQNARELTALGRALECALRLKRLAGRQSNLVRLLSRFEKETRQSEMGAVHGLGGRQQEIRQDLAQLKADMIERAGQLPPGYDKLKADMQTLAGAIGEYEMTGADEFSEALQNYEIPGLMGKSVKASEKPDGSLSHRYSSMALERIQRLLQGGCTNGSGFADMAGSDPGRGPGGGGNGPSEVRQDLRQTLNQMLQALLMRQKPGDGEGNEGENPGLGQAGPGGAPDSGYWVPGTSMLNVPTFGPERMTTIPVPGQAEGGAGAGTGRGGPTVGPRSTETMNIQSRTGVKSESMPMEAVPDKYRNAVRRYFSAQ